MNDAQMADVFAEAASVRLASPRELIWRRTAARERDQMRQIAGLWRVTGDDAYLRIAIGCRDRAAMAQAVADQCVRQEGRAA